MKGPRDYYRIFKKDGNSTSFHFIDSTLIPVSNFELALKWRHSKELTAASLKEFDALISDTVLRKRYKKFFEDSEKVPFYGYREKAAAY
jgi:hypothetical protein